MEATRRQTVFRVLVVFAFVWGCVTFAAGVSWLTSALDWAQKDRAVEWQQYSMSALLLAFPIMVLLATRWPRRLVWIFLLMFAVTLAQGVGITSSAGYGASAALVGGLGLVGVPALLAAWLFWWRSGWQSQKPRRKITSRQPR